MAKTDFNRSRYGEVIRSGRKQAGLSQQALADRLGVPKTYVGHWEAGRSRPDLNLVPALCGALGISLARFFGTAENGDAFSEREKQLIERYRRADARDKAVLEAALDKMVALKEDALWEYCRTHFRTVAHNDQSAAAGAGTALDSETATYPVFVRISAISERADEIVTVSGSSMEPAFYPGDEVYIEHTPEVKNGETGLFVVNGSGYIKQLREGRLHSLNPAYGDVLLYETDEIRCVGRVLGTVGRNDYPTNDELAVLEELRRETRGGSL